MANSKYKEMFSRRLQIALEQKEVLTGRENISQAEVADALHVTPQSVNYYFTGKRLPNAEILARIARYLGTTADYLVGLENVTANVEVECRTPVEKLIISSGFTQAEICAKLKDYGVDIKKDRMSRIVSGKAELRPVEIAAFAQFFNTTADYLIGLTDRPELSTEV